MRWIFVSLITAATASVLADRPDRNSFIDYPIHSTSDLIRQIKTDPAVADRYERNFSMTRDQVIQYMAGLHFDHLREGGQFNVYSVPPDGHIKWHEQTLKKGMAVISDASGQPVMLVKCGNPLVMSSPAPSVPAPSGAAAPMVELPPPPADGVQPEMAMAPPPATPADIYVPPAAEPLPPGGAAFTGTGAAAGGANYAWVGFLAAGGIIYGLTTIHGSTHHPTPPAVPEPASIAFVGLGVTGLIFSRKKLR